METFKNWNPLAAGVALVAAFVLGLAALPALAQVSTATQDGSRTAGALSGPGTGMMGGSGSGMGMGMMGDVDRHFIEMMIPHHQAAIDMADLALQKAQRQDVKDLAANIKRVQTAEIAQMRAWYSQWYGVAVPASPNGSGSASGMGSGMMGGSGSMMDQGRMYGDLAALKNAADFDKAFIQMMVPHHQMALMMSQMVLAQGQQPALKNLAQSIITSQSAEIAQMQTWYQQWYGTALP